MTTIPQTFDEEEPFDDTGARAKVALAAFAVLVIVGMGIAGIFRFVAAERARDLLQWQVRMGIVADSRLQAVNGWLDEQSSFIRDLGENASIRLYVTELAAAAGDPRRVADERAQRGYIRNLLTVAAGRAGFAGPATGPTVAANIERVGTTGLALVDGGGRVLAASPSMPPVAPLARTLLSRASAGGAVLRDLYLDHGGRLAMAFATPVHGVQDDPGGSAAIGYVIGVKRVTSEIMPLLRQLGQTSNSAEIMLVRETRTTIEYLSPLADGSAPLKKVLARDTPHLAAAFAAAMPGGFARKRDYGNVDVLVTGRRVAGTPWAIVYKIDAAEALAETDARRSRLLIALLLVAAAVIAALIAVWRNGASVRADRAAENYRRAAGQHRSLSAFLRLVTDSQPNSIVIVDDAGRYRFANSTAAAEAGMGSDDMVGKSLSSVIGAAAARPLAAANREATARGQAVVETFVFDGPAADGAAAEGRVIRSQHIPLAATADAPAGVLMVQQNITDAIRERHRRERILRQIVDALVGVVDQRDPYSSNHSVRVGALAGVVAAEMGLSDVEIETAEIAGALMNLGKLFVPSELLTKTDPLSAAELKVIRDAMRTSAELLSGIEFDGPVVETLSQINERWDGAGQPAGLVGDEILPSARAVAVANAFVAMVSPRAYRAGATADAAIDHLGAEMGRSLDRRAVAALIGHLDNHGGRADWTDDDAA